MWHIIHRPARRVNHPRIGRDIALNGRQSKIFICQGADRAFTASRGASPGPILKYSISNMGAFVNTKIVNNL